MGSCASSRRRRPIQGADLAKEGSRNRPVPPRSRRPPAATPAAWRWAASQFVASSTWQRTRSIRLAPHRYFTPRTTSVAARSGRDAASVSEWPARGGRRRLRAARSPARRPPQRTRPDHNPRPHQTPAFQFSRRRSPQHNHCGTFARGVGSAATVTGPGMTRRRHKTRPRHPLPRRRSARRGPAETRTLRRRMGDGGEGRASRRLRHPRGVSWPAVVQNRHSRDGAGAGQGGTGTTVDLCFDLQAGEGDWSLTVFAGLRATICDAEGGAP